MEEGEEGRGDEGTETVWRMIWHVEDSSHIRTKEPIDQSVTRMSGADLAAM